MAVHVFLHSNLVLVSLGEGYEVCKLNFLMRYVKFHSISKCALEIMSEQTRRGGKNVQIASIWAHKSHLEGLWRCLCDRKSKLPRPKWSQEWFAPVPISDFWIKNGTKIYKKNGCKKRSRKSKPNYSKMLKNWIKIVFKKRAGNQMCATCNDCWFLKAVLNNILTFEVETVFNWKNQNWTKKTSSTWTPQKNTKKCPLSGR